MRLKLVWWIPFAFCGVVHAVPQSLVPTPTAAGYAVLDVEQVDSVLPAPLDLASLGAEDVTRERLGMPPRFALPQRVSITPAGHGTWEDLGDGLMLWRLRIVGGAETTSLNLGFTRFKLPQGARLLLYATDGSQVARPFTAADNEQHGELWTPVVPTTDLVVELTVPKRETPAVELELGWINQGYRGFGTTAAEDYVKSGSCNLDVECLPPGDPWRAEMRAVGVISTGGSTFCTGSLVNNTAGDHKMYFITADHCGINFLNAASLVVYWNYQNSFCRTPGSAQSGQAGNGLLNQFHTGSIFRASYHPSDVTLVELDDPPVPAYGHRWAGWDRSTGDFACSLATPCATIHHPQTDEKRITYSTTVTQTTSYGGGSSPGDGTHIWVHWATDPPGPFTVPGATEPGSSGSPLYNGVGRFIGQLHGGPSACGSTGDNLSDYYGRFSVSWTGGGTNSTRLSSWLDPGHTGATTLGGINATSAADFYTLAPCRVVDTRNPAGTYGGPALSAGSARSFPLAGTCGIPAAAKAVSVNLTVTGPTQAGHLLAYPGGVTPPLASLINFSVGQTRANNAILPLAADGNGTLTFEAGLAGGGTVHLIVDVSGYFLSL
jgi:hypothetical protein